MSMVNRCNICDAPMDNFGRDGAICKGHEKMTTPNIPEQSHREANLEVLIDTLGQEADALLQRVEMLTEALTYYAEDVNAALHDDRDNDGYGKRARTALAQASEPRA